MVDIFKEEICNYCRNKRQEENICYKQEIIEIEKGGLKILRCTNYQKDSSKIIPIERPLPITAKRDYIKYHEI